MPNVVIQLLRLGLQSPYKSPHEENGKYCREYDSITLRHVLDKSNECRCGKNTDHDKSRDHVQGEIQLFGGHGFHLFASSICLKKRAKAGSGSTGLPSMSRAMMCHARTKLAKFPPAPEIAV